MDLKRFMWNGKDKMGFVLNSVTLSTHAGANFVSLFSLRFVKLVQVSREGIIYDIIQSASFFPVTPPANSRKVSYYAPLGEFIFPTNATFNPGETVTIKWKT